MYQCSWGPNLFILLLNETHYKLMVFTTIKLLMSLQNNFKCLFIKRLLVRIQKA